MYAVLDTETTGLTPEQEVIEVAVMLVDENTLATHQTYQAKIRPERIHLAEPRALEVNGYDEEDWRHARPASVVLAEVQEMVKGCILVGHNVGFDEMMINANLARSGVKGRLPYQKIDTATLVREHLFPMGLKHSGLDSVRRFLGWPVSEFHTALTDVQDTYQLFRLLWRATTFRRYLIALTRKLGEPVGMMR
jgi:DNA polymerase III alpha subunit (gram-positive type)